MKRNLYWPITTLSLALLLFFLPQQSQSSDKITKTTICSLTSKPENFDGKLIEVRAYAVTDMHMTILYGLESEGAGVTLKVPEGKNNDPEFDRLFERSFGPEVATGQRRVWATFVGTIEWRRKESPNLILALKQISDITIEEPASGADTYPTLASAEFLGVKFKSGHPSVGETFLDAAKSPGVDQETRLEIDAHGLKTIPGARVEILGFTDDSECSGQKCYELSLRRAKIVYDWFISHGVPKESLKEPEGHGNEMAIYGNETEEGRQQNRRTEVNMIAP